MSAGTQHELWTAHGRTWRDPEAVAVHWREAADVNPRLLRGRAKGAFWEELERLAIVLLVSREYEHFVMGLSAREGRPRATYLALPHPSGVAVDPAGARVMIASTRNPNQVLELQPVGDPDSGDRVLMPRSTSFHPGRLYLHDLAFVGGRLHGNATGMNAVVRLDGPAAAEPVWWPRAVEQDGVPDLARNTVQLNSIAAGDTLATSFFSASTARVSARRPGHRNFPVDGRGVVFAGASREPVCAGLTRPHSARLRGGRLWVDNSGYGEVGIVLGGRFEPVTRLPGWTRGLCFVDDVAIVGTSRVLPRFRQYAPGLEEERSECAVHIIDACTGAVRGSLGWAAGNQIFAVESLPGGAVLGFPFSSGRRSPARIRSLFYDFRP